MKFSDIPGHENVKRQLRDMVDSGRMPHAVLLHGPAGVGKLALARALAQYLHCQDRRGGEPCGVCPACRQVQTFNHPDTLYVYPVVKTDKVKAPVSDDYAAEFRAELARSPFMDFEHWAAGFDKKNAQPQIYVGESENLERRLALTSTASDYKVVVVWLPEKMNEQTANKLLKLIEEPLGRTAFIMASDDAAAVLPTVRSRCRPVEALRLSDAEVAGWLRRERGVDPAQAVAVAHIADGSATAAMRELDATQTQRMFLDLFKQLMRGAWARRVGDLRKWADDTAALGREQEVKFLTYCRRMVRENYFNNFGRPELTYMNADECEFASRFSRFVNENNAPRLVAAFDDAATDIAGNANGKIVLFDLAVKVIMLLIVK